MLRFNFVAFQITKTKLCMGEQVPRTSLSLFLSPLLRSRCLIAALYFDEWTHVAGYILSSYGIEIVPEANTFGLTSMGVKRTAG